MTLLGRAFTEVNDSQAERLAQPSRSFYTVEVHPPRNGKVAATVEDFVRGILEIQTQLLGLKNASPVCTFEVVRAKPDRLRLQYCVPTKRLERKVRTQLSHTVPGVGFSEGDPLVPVSPGDSIGGGLLKLGRKDRFPLRTDFGSPPINSVVSSLHRHAMRDTKVVVQILFQPVAGQPLKTWWRKNRGYKTVGFLRKEKEQLWGQRSATPRERKQADAVERKLGQRTFWVSIRFAVIGAGEYTRSRVKELAVGFNIFESPNTGQYLDTVTITGLRKKRFHGFYQAVKNRVFGGYSLRFEATVEELGALLSVPDVDQENLEGAEP